MPLPKDENEIKFVDSLLCSYFVSVLAAWNAEIVSYPLDLVKTRLQIQGEIANKQDAKITRAPYRGMVRTTIGIAMEEGPLKLYQGISAQFLRQLIYSGSRVVVYRALKDNVFYQKPNENYFPLWKSAACGCTAGALAQFVGNPADLVKVHLQMEGRRRLTGMPPRVHGIVDAFSKVIRQSGFTGLWKGSVPNMWRAALVSLGDLSTYDLVKRFILRNTNLEDNIFVHTMSSFCAGFVAAAMSTPADVIKTRIMNQPFGKDGRGLLYSNSLDCILKTVNSEGVLALYKGFLPLWIRLGPWALTFWISYEQINHYIGAAQF